MKEVVNPAQGSVLDKKHDALGDRSGIVKSMTSLSSPRVLRHLYGCYYSSGSAPSVYQVGIFSLACLFFRSLNLLVPLGLNTSQSEFSIRSGSGLHTLDALRKIRNSLIRPPISGERGCQLLGCYPSQSSPAHAEPLLAAKDTNLPTPITLDAVNGSVSGSNPARLSMAWEKEKPEYDDGTFGLLFALRLLVYSSKFVFHSAVITFEQLRQSQTNP